MDGKRISQLTPDTSPSTDDFIVTVDGTTTQNKRVELGSLPVSNPTNALFDTKVDKAPGKQLSDQNYTQDERNKLAGIEAGAEVNEVSSADLALKANASDTVNLTGNQTVAGIKTFSSSPVVPTATTGTQAVNKAQMDAADALKLNISDNRVELRGVGYPQGVVSAPVGTTYVDTAATNGAIEWKKATGTGNTGWIVSVGDTGWRNIASMLINGWTVSLIRIRRVGNEVNILIEGLNAASSTNASCISLPSGFGVYSIASARQLLHTAATPAVVYRTAAEFGNLAVSGATTSTPTLYGGNLYLTNDAWPITLPGTAA